MKTTNFVTSTADFPEILEEYCGKTVRVMNETGFGSYGGVMGVDGVLQLHGCHDNEFIVHNGIGQEIANFNLSHIRACAIDFVTKPTVLVGPTLRIYLEEISE